VNFYLPLSLLSIPLFLSLSLSSLCTHLSFRFDHSTRLRATFRGVRQEDPGSLRNHRTLYVVTAVIATDYILLWDLLLQRLHTFRGQAVANLHTHRECYDVVNVIY